MAFIQQLVANGPSLVLGSEEFVRPMIFGGNWRKIRVGIYFTIYSPNVAYVLPTGYVAQNNAQLYVGVCQGATSGVSQQFPIDALYAWPNHDYGTLANTGGPPYYSNFGTAHYGFSWAYGTSLATSLGSGSSNPCYIPFYPTHGQMFFDFTMSPAAHTAVLTPFYTQTAADAQTDLSRSTFLSNMENESSLTNGSLQATQSLTYNGNYNLNSVCVYWSRSVPPLILFEVCVLRYY